MKITKIQVLSHQSKIAKKIDIFIGTGRIFEDCTWKRLGYLSLDSNERSNYQARELKTVFVDHVGRFMKFVINENYMNKQNVYNQVGIVAVSLAGEELFDERGAEAKKSPVYKNPYNDLTVDITLDPQTASKLRQLAEAKSKAIANEDYATAKQIKSVEQDLKMLGSRLAQLNMAKSEAVAAEDYDLAKEIKDESDSLRVEIEQMVTFSSFDYLWQFRSNLCVLYRFEVFRYLEEPQLNVRHEMRLENGTMTTKVNCRFDVRRTMLSTACQWVATERKS